MKNLFIFLLVLFISFEANSQNETWYKVRINLEGKDLKLLAETGIDVTSGIIKPGLFFETDLSGKELEKVKKAGFSYKILITDVSSFYAERAAEDSHFIDRSKYEEWPVPEHWEYGSMGGFYTLDEVMSELDEMHQLYPELTTPRLALSDNNLTHEGRKQFWMEISDNPGIDEGEPEILYTGLHHAREPMSYQQMIWFMWYLLENYDSDPEIKSLVDNTAIYFIPIVNPDGLAYNMQTNPNGGGMWRKNRRNNGDGSYGVDPNRNYGYKWGLDDIGSSPEPSDQTYRGPYAFSEPIIANIRDFCSVHDFKLALNYHSYSNLLLYPWGYTDELPPDNDLLHLYAEMMTKENHYTMGPANTTIYAVNGDSNDWMYGDTIIKGKIFAYTPEIGGSSDGFWPSTSRIIPLCREQMWQNMTALKVVGKYAVAKDISPLVLNESSGYLKFNLTRLGITQCDTFKVYIEPLDENLLQVNGNPAYFTGMTINQTLSDSLPYNIYANPDSVAVIKYLLKVDNGMFVETDTITKYYGSFITLFDDDCSNLNNWNPDGWGITNESYNSPSYSITDSPNQDYDNYTNSFIKLKDEIDLTNSPISFLTFWTKWEIEAGWDYAQLMIKPENGTWQPVATEHTHPGSIHQDEGQPVYDGQQTEWTREIVSLKNYSGKKIKLGFRLVSDSYIVKDGFYFDDVNVSIVGSVTGIKNNDKIFVSQPFPNPSNEIIKVPYNNNAAGGKYKLISVSGKTVAQGNLEHGNNIITVNVSGLNKGVYFLKLETGKDSAVKKLVVN